MAKPIDAPTLNDAAGSNEDAITASERASGEGREPFVRPKTQAMLSLGRRLAAAREGRRLTQGELAKELGKSRATVNQYEAGSIEPPLKMVTKLASVLNVDPASLAFGNAISSSGRGADSPLVPEWVSRNEAPLSAALTSRIGFVPSGDQLIELAGDAPSFGLRRGDLLIVDLSVTRVSGDGRLYAAQVGAGDLSIVRSDLQLMVNPASVRLTLGQGQEVEVDPDKIQIVGLIKATVRFE